MNSLIANILTYAVMMLLPNSALSNLAMALNPATKPALNVADSSSNRLLSQATASKTDANSDGESWIGTWAAAAQPFIPQTLQTFHNQSLRLIVHTSAAGTKVRVKISNTYGDKPLLIGGAHIAHRISAAKIDPRSDRTWEDALWGSGLSRSA